MTATEQAAAPVDTDTLPPTQFLVLEVLAARYRTGETYWTLPDRCAPAARALERAGLVWLRSAPVSGHFEARFTDAGRAAALLDGYVTPNDAKLRKAVAEEIARAVEAMCPEPGGVHVGGDCDFAAAAAVAREHAEVIR